MAAPRQNGRLRYEWLFEWVIVPMTGLTLAVVGSLTGWISGAWIPVIAGFVVFPFARVVDKLRREE